MTLRKDGSGADRPDELDALLRWALYDSTSQLYPPDAVWERIESTIQRQLTCENMGAVWAVWRGIGRSVRRLIDSGTIQRVHHGALYQPVILFSGWESYIPFSLACVVEQEMSILRFGWAT